MPLTPAETILTILAVALGAMATRFTPFLLFPENRQPPETISYLGRVLPPAMIGFLVVYCFKGVSVTLSPYGIPELISIVFIILLHRWKGNVLLSIAGGTAVYMFLVQTIFVA
jgi:branched-subunit amino acid transport protein AzlD